MEPAPCRRRAPAARAGRRPGSGLAKALWMGAALVSIAVLALALGRGRETLRVGGHIDLDRRTTPPPIYRDPIPPPPIATGPGPAVSGRHPGTGRAPDALSDLPPGRRAAPIPTAAQRPDPAPARPTDTDRGQRPAAPAAAEALDPEAVIARFQRHFAAGDLPGLLLLLTDDARIGRLTDDNSTDAGADLFAATLKRAFRLTPLRLRPDGRDRYLADGDLLGTNGRPAARQAGALRLELTRQAAGYRISALLYRIESTPNP